MPDEVTKRQTDRQTQTIIPVHRCNFTRVSRLLTQKALVISPRNLFTWPASLYEGRVLQHNTLNWYIDMETSMLGS